MYIDRVNVPMAKKNDLVKVTWKGETAVDDFNSLAKKDIKNIDKEPITMKHIPLFDLVGVIWFSKFSGAWSIKKGNYSPFFSNDELEATTLSCFESLWDSDG